MGERRNFSKEYKLAAIAPLLAGQKSVSQQAENLGVDRSSLQRWLAAYSSAGEQAFPGSGHQTGAEAEISELKRKLKAAEMERDILKKAMAIFSKERP